jgi:hypothetical protein
METILMPPTHTSAPRPSSIAWPLLLSALIAVVASPVKAATLYVWQDSPSPDSTFTTWAKAAHTIQEAVDAAQVGDTVLVTNGVYSSGGKAAGTNILVNRVAVDKPMTLTSVNGPECTVIQGYQVPGTTNGDGAIRCVYLTNGAVLSGFTLSNGATRTVFEPSTCRESVGGGVRCEFAALVTNCTFTGNSAYWAGGGAYGGMIEDCVFAANWAGKYGGGAADATLDHCILSANYADYEGGGASSSALDQCTLTGNSSVWGGGVSYSTLNLCTLTNNWAGAGGGSYNATLHQCVLLANTAYIYGGGAGGGTLDQCTLVGNSAHLDPGGGAATSDEWGCSLNNCILFDNTAPAGPNYSDDSRLNYCCTTPLPGSGTGNITNPPMFVDRLNGNLRLQSNSPCINAGDSAYASGTTDLDGNPRIVNDTVDIGAYEWQVPTRFAPMAPPGLDGLQLHLFGEVGRTYDIHASSNLANWFWLAHLTNTTGQATYTDPLSPCPPARFYKATAIP